VPNLYKPEVLLGLRKYFRGRKYFLNQGSTSLDIKRVLKSPKIGVQK
jgi:hypothetical protein